MSLDVANLFPKVAMGILILCMLLHLIAIGAPNWAKVEYSYADREEHIGLWRYCTYPYGGSQTCNDFVDIVVGDWIKACEAFMILGLFTLPAAIGIVAMYAFVEDYKENMKVAGAAMGLTFTAGLFVLICIAAFGDSYQEYFNNKEPMWENVGRLDWAFGLAATEVILIFIALGFLIASLAGDRNEKK